MFMSPVLTAASLSEKEMIPPECVPSYYNGECHANQLRKMQASFSWDWGPALPSVGIWLILLYNIIISFVSTSENLS